LIVLIVVAFASYACFNTGGGEEISDDDVAADDDTCLNA